MANRYDKILIRRGTEEEWLLVDPILDIGEPAYVTDKLMTKHGDGIHKFSELEYDNAGVYSTDIPLPVDIGGFKAGDMPTGKTQSEMWDILLHPYVKPTINISVNPSSGMREYTNNITNTTITASVIEKSRPITKVEFLLNNSIIGTMTEPSSSSTDPVTKFKTNKYIFTYNEIISSLTTNGLASSRTINAKAYDSEGNTLSGNATYTFVSPMYVGYVDSTVSIMTDELVRSMTKKIQTKSDVSNTYTLTNKKIAFACPASFGELKSILDANGFENIDNFEKSTIDVTQYDNSTKVSYYVYIMKKPANQLTNFKFTFKF